LITRSCNNFGPNQHKEKFLPKIAHSICNNLEVPLYGDGCQSREWIHVDDNADLILELTLSDTAKNGVYNIGSNLHYKNIEIIQILSGFLNKSVKYKHVADRLGHDKVYRLNCSKLFSFYGEFTPYPLEGFLKDEINKYEDSVNRR
jgi:dTDP-glucose 4,6-dehydratase